MNHQGLSISYNELLRYHKNMSAYIMQRGEDKVPIPCHIKLDAFTMGAFDNFDHEEATMSGIGGTHDTVSILFQNQHSESLKRPLISETMVQQQIINQKPLMCQELKEYIKPIQRGTISNTFTAAKEYSMNSVYTCEY